MKQTNNSIELNHIDLHKDLMLSNTPCNVQPSPELAPRVFPPLPYPKGNLQFLKKPQFQNSDLNPSEHFQLCNNLVENKHCDAAHRNCVGKFSTPFRNRLNLDAKMQTQKPTEILFQ